MWALIATEPSGIKQLENKSNDIWIFRANIVTSFFFVFRFDKDMIPQKRACYIYFFHVFGLNKDIIPQKLACIQNSSLCCETFECSQELSRQEHVTEVDCNSHSRVMLQFEIRRKKCKINISRKDYYISCLLIKVRLIIILYLILSVAKKYLSKQTICMKCQTHVLVK